MKVYRSPMEKILEEMENGLIITNPRQPVRTFFRKINYLLAWWTSRIINLFHK
ncbi:MAG: hypothetical protein HQK55_03630 [Deltaproteobacteria bacterium]|nr:hypothetical protein [Deltaproteobacteria bacterium]